MICISCESCVSCIVLRELHLVALIAPIFSTVVAIKKGTVAFCEYSITLMHMNWVEEGFIKGTLKCAHLWHL